MSAHIPSAKLAAALDDLLPLGVDVGDVLLMLGMQYRSALRSLRRSGRNDLAEKLLAWKEQDAERLKRALGRVWL